jgi:hypothetical protein
VVCHAVLTISLQIFTADNLLNAKLEGKLSRLQLRLLIKQAPNLFDPGILARMAELEKQAAEDGVAVSAERYNYFYFFQLQCCYICCDSRYLVLWLTKTAKPFRRRHILSAKMRVS